MYNVYELRKQFPMLSEDKKMQGKPLVYLDNCSTTFKPQCVIDAVTKYYTEMTANSHRGDYDLLYNMDVEVDNTRKVIADFINADKREVVFTAGDTMSLNLVAWGYARKILNKDDEILITEEDHASNILPWYQIAHLTGAKVKFINLTKDGDVTPENLEKAMSEKTKIVSLPHISNVIGYELNIPELTKVVHKHGAIIVVDGAQSVPHIKTDFKAWDIDFLTFSAHKMCGPTGIGCLVGKYELLDFMDSFITGGGMNMTFDKEMNMELLPPPAKFEAGTQHLAGILGFKAAVEFIQSIGIENIHQHDIELVEYAKEKLANANITIYNKNSKGGMLTFNVNGIFAQDEATLLNSKGIAVRSGQHCDKVIDDFIGTKATCRMSVYLYTTKEEVDAFVDAILNGGDILDAYFSF